MKKFWLCAAAAAVLAAAPAAQAQIQAADDLASPKYGTWGYDLQGRNAAMKPGEDFFRFANGTYIEKLVIPADRSRFGNFDLLADLSQRRVHQVLEAAGKNRAARGEEAQIGAYYRAFMDEKAIEARGIAPLKPELDAIRAARTHNDIAAIMGRAPKSLPNSLFGIYIGADDKEPDRYAVNVFQGGLNLPDRDYYLQASFADKKAAYELYVAQMLERVDWPDPAGAAKAIVAFETEIAEVSWTRVERRDPDKMYNPMTPAELASAAPGFPWATWLRAADLGRVNRLVIAESTALPKIAAIYAKTPVSTLKAWTAFTAVDNAAPYLPERFVQARFLFRNKTLAGTPELQPRWKRAVATVERGMGEAVGRVYVSRYFTPEAKAKMEALIGDLRGAFKARLDTLEWMSPATRAAADTKLANFRIKIGYPSKWRDYSALRIREDDLVGNVIRSGAFEWAYEVGRLDKKVDREDWSMTPQTVNAYHNPVMVEVVFPAAILQAPFFDPDADPAINYGGIGGVIGHELIHGFDDQGRKYSAMGKLENWWTGDDAKRFEGEAKKLGAQYSAFEPLPGAKVNGELTMGENIADLGGLTLALEAYHRSLGGKPAPVIDGLTGDQRVFLGWAQVWRQKYRDDALRQQVVSDPHSPPEYRVNGVVRNIDAWYQAFGVQPGDKLYIPPEQRVRIW